MIIIYNGLPGSGKTTKLADKALHILQRNYKYFKKSGNKRLLLSNIKFSPEVEEKYPDFIVYWSDLEQLIKYRDCDVLWDEVATMLDSTQWANTSLEVKRFLQQHRKYGIDIYGTTQDFLMIDIAMRRLVAKAFLMRKLVGSRDKSATLPPVKNPWGFILIREIDPDCFRTDKSEYKFVGFDFLILGKQLCNAFDTTQEIEIGSYPPLKHIVRKCSHVGCGFEKVLHY